MRQNRFSKVNFDTQQMIDFINRFNMNKWLIDKNNNFFIQLIDQALLLKMDHMYQKQMPGIFIKSGFVVMMFHLYL